MRRIFKISILMILIACFISLSPLASYAQVGRRFRTDILFNMDWMQNDSDHLKDGDINSFLVALDAGYFITHWLEVGPEISYMMNEKGTDDYTLWSFVLKTNLHFLTDSLVSPYFGFRVGLGTVDAELISKTGNIVKLDDNSFCYGIQTGLNYFLTDNVSLNPEIRYTIASYDGKYENTAISADVDSGDLTFVIGLGLYF